MAVSMKLWEFIVSWKKYYICTLHIVFLFVKSENNNFIRNKSFLCLHSVVKTSAKFVQILKQLKKPQLHLRFLLICSWILPNIALIFAPVCDA